MLAICFDDLAYLSSRKVDSWSWDGCPGSIRCVEHPCLRRLPVTSSIQYQCCANPVGNQGRLPEQVCIVLLVVPLQASSRWLEAGRMSENPQLH